MTGVQTCALPIYYIIAPAEASANLARFDGVRYGYRNVDATSAPEMTTMSRTEGFGQEVRRLYRLGNLAGDGAGGGSSSGDD